MPQEPKKRHSRARQGKRRAAISLQVTNRGHKLTHFYSMLEKEQAEKPEKTKENKPSSDQEE